MKRISHGLLVSLVLLTRCAGPTSTSDSAHHILRAETCLAEVAHLDPGPIDGVADAALEQALQTYIADFARRDLMAMGRDPQSRDVRQAALRALFYHCWKQGHLPATDPLRQVPPPPPL